ncbi:TVP38/TMEM64 family protein [Nonlabens antarcticus]|uniref:TVP38/TMEM64 family protein n=1 Tax=Nonlabens antarcticus TaxID=392714 RepID=UPI001891C641|nr:TVP38/TMEM64 family protein [Nonlabens antarcticus]
MSRKETASKSHLPLYLSVGLIIAIVLSYYTIPSVQEFLKEAWQVLTSDDEQEIQRWVGGFGWYGPIVLILAMILQMFLIVIPTILLMVVSILAYGPYWGSIIILIAVFAASTVGYAIGKYLSHAFISKILGPKAGNKIEGFIEQYGFWAVIVTRLNPFLSNDAISLVGGMLRMGYWKFIGATLIGILPLTIFIAIMGRTTDGLKSGLSWGSVVSIVAFAGYMLWNKSKNK